MDNFTPWLDKRIAAIEVDDFKVHPCNLAHLAGMAYGASTIATILEADGDRFSPEEGEPDPLLNANQRGGLIAALTQLNWNMMIAIDNIIERAEKHAHSREAK